MEKNYKNAQEFYHEALKDVDKMLVRKGLILGLMPSDVYKAIQDQYLTKFIKKQTEDEIEEEYAYKGILLFTVLWSPMGMRYKEINKDETTFNRPRN